MVALSVLRGTCTAWGGSCDSRSRTPGNDADDTPPGGGVAHTSAFEPAPEETGTAPYGRVPKIGAGPPPINPDRSLAEIGLQLAVRDRKAVFWQTLTIKGDLMTYTG